MRLALGDPDEADFDDVCGIRDGIEARVTALFDRPAAEYVGRTPSATTPGSTGLYTHTERY